MNLIVPRYPLFSLVVVTHTHTRTKQGQAKISWEEKSEDERHGVVGAFFGGGGRRGRPPDRRVIQ